MGDEREWGLMKKHIRKLRRFKQRALGRTNASNVCVVPRTRKPAQHNGSTSIVDEDELDYSSDTNDPFEEQEDHRIVCHRIDWNVHHHHSNVFLLTTYLHSEDAVCSISDIVSGHRYPHLCEVGG